MKIIIMLSFLVSISFSQTGKDFLRDYPHNIPKRDWDNSDYQMAIKFESTAFGYIAGNADFSSTFGNPYQIPASPLRKNIILENLLCYLSDGIEITQLIRLTLKYCKENPAKTHLRFTDILVLAIKGLGPGDVCKKALNSQ
jgi:hypothetical protein